MSDFRDDVIAQLIEAGEHPKRVHDMLDVLQEAFADKLQAQVGESVYTGLHEALCFVRNLRLDIARDYGYIEEGN